MTTSPRIPDVYQKQAELLRALGHPVRMAIVRVLRDGEQCVCHMEATLGLRQSYISQHLMILREAGLVEVRRDGWNIFYRLTHPEIQRLTDALAALTGRGAPPLKHLHAAGACPCPKCTHKSEGRAGRGDRKEQPQHA